MCTCPECKEHSGSCRRGRTLAGGRLWVRDEDRFQSLSALWVEKVVPAEVVSGASFDYEIRATNLTGGSLDSVTVWDTIPANFKVSAVSPQGQMGPNGMTWNLGSLAAGETKTVKVTGSATGVGAVNGCAGGSFSTALCTSIAVVQPALRLVKTAPAEVTVCDPIPVKLVVTNTGTGAARNVKVTDKLPAGLTTADGKTELTFDAGTLGAGQSREFTFNAKAAKPGSFQNSASAASESGLKADSGATTTKVTQPVLAITKKGPERLFIGKPATYEITVTNTGDTPATATVIEDPTPAGSVFVSASDNGRLSGGTVAWAVGTLAPKASKTVQVTFNYSTIGEIRNTASAKATCAAAVTATAGTQMAGIPALLLDGSDAPDPVQLGDNVVYTLTVTNQGSAPLTNVKLSCMMDEGDTMQYVSSTGATNGTAQGRAINFAPIARLDPKQSATYRITVKAMKEAQVQFRGEASSDQITRPLLKVETTNFYK